DNHRGAGIYRHRTACDVAPQTPSPAFGSPSSLSGLCSRLETHPLCQRRQQPLIQNCDLTSPLYSSITLPDPKKLCLESTLSRWSSTPAPQPRTRPRRRGTADNVRSTRRPPSVQNATGALTLIDTRPRPTAVLVRGFGRHSLCRDSCS